MRSFLLLLQIPFCVVCMIGATFIIGKIIEGNNVHGDLRAWAFLIAITLSAVMIGVLFFKTARSASELFLRLVVASSALGLLFYPCTVRDYHFYVDFLVITGLIALFPSLLQAIQAVKKIASNSSLSNHLSSNL